MSEKRHTPGPWVTAESGGLVWSDRGRYTNQVVAATGYDSRVSKAEQEANARLIAAAPTMLEELRRAVTHCPCSLEMRLSGHGVDCWAPDAEAAIAKAEGR